MAGLNKKVVNEYNKNRSFFKRRYLCYAPFTSLRFSQNGHVYSCCHNKFYSLGKYPEKSIREIWEGEKLMKLRSAIENNNLSAGCYSCDETIKSRNYSYTEALMFDNLPRSKKSQPVLFDFQLDNTCNLACIMCNSEDSSQWEIKASAIKHSSPYDQNFIDQLTEFYPYLFEARFLGGEPFLIKPYYDIWKNILEHNPKINISILTNGTILNDTIINLLSKGNFFISLSVDSFNKETYEAIRQNSNFDNMMGNFDYFYQYAVQKKYTLNVNVCPLTKNVSELPGLFDYCNEKNIIIHLHKVNYPANLAIWNLPALEISSLTKYLEENLPVRKNKVAKINHRTYLSFLQQMRIWEQNKLNVPESGNTSVNELKQNLLKSFEHFITNDDILICNNEKDLFLNKYTSILEELLIMRKTDYEKIRFITGIANIPVYYIISEFENKDLETINNRIKSMIYV